MLRVARRFVATNEAAEDVVQETFLGVIQGIDRFEGRSSLKTWIFRILVNRAKTRGERERGPGRSRRWPASSRPTSRRRPRPLPLRRRWAGSWATPPSPRLPEASARGRGRGAAVAVIDALPPAQRTVITLRDVEGFSAGGLPPAGAQRGNQRVLLHRARAKVRAAIEHYLGEEDA